MSLREPLVQLFKKYWRTAALAVTFLVALGLRLWAAQMYFPRPAICLSALVGTVQLSAERSGVSLLAVPELGEFGLRLDRFTNYGRDEYHYGWRLGLLGVEGAIQTYSFRDHDVVVSPYAGLRLPYWLLIAGPAALLVRSSGIWKDLRPQHFSRGARIVGGVVLALFLVLNLIPEAGRPGARIVPSGVFEHLQLVFLPGSLANEVYLQYGWPSRSYECGVVNGRLVDEYYGHSLGWKQDLLAENLALAALASFSAALAGEWLLRLRQKVATIASVH